MDIFQSFFMGLVQGLTEFLPVSSSGHLILAAKLLGTAPSLATELVFHIATLAAVIVFYRKKILSLLKKPLQKTTFLLLISTVATAPVALLLRDAADEMQDGRLLPLFFTLTAVLLVLSDRLRAKKCNPWMRAAIVGLSQGVAVIPGLSRSGTTISAAMFSGGDRQEASEYSFLLSVPIIIIGAIAEIISHPIENVAALPLTIGLITAFLSGLAALKFLSFVNKKLSPAIFSVYLVVLSAVLLILRFNA